METSKKKGVSPVEKNWHLALRSGSLFASTKLCTDRDLSLLYILISGTYSKFTLKNDFIALGVCFPQPCWPQVCRVKIAFSFDSGVRSLKEKWERSGKEIHEGHG